MPYGAVSEVGKRSSQEDRYAACADLCRVTFNSSPDEDARDDLPHATSSHTGFLDAVPLRSSQQVRDQHQQGQRCTAGLQALHMFAVYDGHAGSTVSQMCADRMQHHVSHALLQTFRPASASSSRAAGSMQKLQAADSGVEALIIKELSTVPEHADRAAATQQPAGMGLGQQQGLAGPHAGSSTCSSSLGTSSSKCQPTPVSADDAQQHCSRISLASTHSTTEAPSGHSLVRSALRSAFLAMDGEVQQQLGPSAALMGSTALVALVGRSHLWLANCGEPCCCC